MDDYENEKGLAGVGIDGAEIFPAPMLLFLNLLHKKKEHAKKNRWFDKVDFEDFHGCLTKERERERERERAGKASKQRRE